MNTAQGLFTFFLNIINNYVVPVIFALAFLMFLVGVYRYFIAGGASEEKVQEGQKFVMWSVIGFVIMFSIWGLVNLFINTLGFNSSTRPQLPTFGAPGNTTNTASQNSSYPDSSQYNYGAPSNSPSGPTQSAPTQSGSSNGNFFTNLFGGGSTNYNPTNTVTNSSNCGSFDSSTGAQGTLCSPGYSCVNSQCVLNAGANPNASTAQCGSFNDYTCSNGQVCNAQGMCTSDTNPSPATVGQSCTDGTTAPVGGSCYSCGNNITTANGADCPASTVYTKCTDGTATANQCTMCQSGVSTAVASNCLENGGSE